MSFRERIPPIIPYLILASSTEGFSSGVSFLFLGLYEAVGSRFEAVDVAATAGRDVVVGGRVFTFTHDGDDCPLFMDRISCEDSDN